jgi:hypothetical protein
VSLDFAMSILLTRFIDRDSLLLKSQDIMMLIAGQSKMSTCEGKLAALKGGALPFLVLKFSME